MQKSYDYDAIVIGSGAAGGMALVFLTCQGRSWQQLLFRQAVTRETVNKIGHSMVYHYAQWV
jgi:succinate dehydrogenase/fumarate reductase flavoprotein subunit